MESSQKTPVAVNAGTDGGGEDFDPVRTFAELSRGG